MCINERCEKCIQFKVLVIMIYQCVNDLAISFVIGSLDIKLTKIRYPRKTSNIMVFSHKCATVQSDIQDQGNGMNYHKI